VAHDVSVGMGSGHGCDSWRVVRVPIDLGCMYITVCASATDWLIQSARFRNAWEDVLRMGRSGSTQKEIPTIVNTVGVDEIIPSISICVGGQLGGYSPG
jgi:hypothetical protein